MLVSIEQPALGGETESWFVAFSGFHGVDTDAMAYFKIPTYQWALLERVVKDAQSHTIYSTFVLSETHK